MTEGDNKYHKELSSLMYALILDLRETDTKTWLIKQKIYWGKFLWRKKEGLEASFQTMVQVRILWSREEGRKTGKEKGQTVASIRKFWQTGGESLRQSLPFKKSVLRNNKPALGLLPCLAISWEQPVGHVTWA